MTQAVSPMLRKLVAVLLLLLAVWAAGSILVGIVAIRRNVEDGIVATRGQYQALRAREATAGKLQQDLKTILSSSKLRLAVLIGRDASAAQAELQKMVRTAAESTHTSLIGLSPGEIRTANLISARFRARVEEKYLSDLLSSLEFGAPQIVLANLSVRPQTASSAAPVMLDISADAETRWIKESAMHE